jgi:hypothetical protein
MGRANYLSKPFDAALLHARIGASLASKRLHDMELEYIEQVGHVTRAAVAVKVCCSLPHSRSFASRSSTVSCSDIARPRSWAAA